MKKIQFPIIWLTSVILTLIVSFFVFSCSARSEQGIDEAQSNGLEWKSTPKLVYSNPVSGDEVYYIKTESPGYVYVVIDKNDNIKSIAAH